MVAVRRVAAAGLLPPRRLKPAWLPLAVLTFTAIVAATLAGALACVGTQILPLAATARLVGSPDASITAIGLGDGPTLRADTQAIRLAVRRALRGVPYRLDAATWSGPLALTGAGGKAGQQAEVASAAELTANAVLVAGAWPGSAPAAGGVQAGGVPDGGIPAAVPAALAGQLGAAPGNVLSLRDLNSGAKLRLRVTGVYRQRDPAASYWRIDQIWTCGASIRNCPASHGPIVVSPASFGRGGLTIAQASWLALPDATRIGAGDLDALAGRITGAVSVLQQPAPGLVVSTGMPGLLRGAAADLAADRSLAAVAAVELLVAAVAALALAAGLLASYRDAETALLGARGASRWQRARLALAEGVPIAAAAGLAGALAGPAVAGVLAGPGTGSGALTAAIWLAELGVFVVCAGVLVWAALRQHGGGARHGRSAAVVRAGADVALVALAAIAVWQLRASSLTASSPTGSAPTGSANVNAVVIVAPALALAGLSLILLRALPAAARLTDRISAAARRLGVALASWEIGRRPVRQAGPVVLAVFTVAAGTLALAQYASRQQAARDQAAFSTGADVRVDDQVPVPLCSVGAVTHAPGVTAAMSATAVDTGGDGDVLAVDARAAAATLLQPGLSAPSLWRRIVPAGPPPGLALPGNPARLAVTAALAGGSLGPAAAAVVSVQDASGAVYAVPAGTLPADGKPHGLAALLAPARRADYPLRLLGLTLSYPLPARRAAAARLTISGIAVARPAAGAFGAPFARGSALASWRATASSPGLASQGVPSTSAGSPRAGAWQALASGAQSLTFQPGYAPGTSGPPLTAMLTIAARAPAAVIPAIATRAFTDGSGGGVGATVAVPVGTDTVQVKIVAVVAHFPTASSALIVDQAAVQDLLADRQDQPLPVTRWWLRTATGAVPPGLPAGSVVTTRAGRVAALLGDPLAAAEQRVMLAAALAMVLLAAVGFAASVAVGLRAGREQSALLTALGVPRPAQVRLACLEQLVLGVPACVAGLLAATGLAYLLIPAVVFPLGWEILLVAAVAAVPVLAAATSMIRPRGGGAVTW